MTLENVLTKVHEKLANDEIGLAIQKCDSEIGELALTCLRKKRANQNQGDATQVSKLDSIKKILLDGLGTAKDKIKNTPGGTNIASGLGGAALGGLFGNLSSSKGEFETDEDFKRRKRNSTLSGLVAGGAIGASVPSVLKGLGGTQNNESGQGDAEWALKDKVKNIINPTTILASGGAAGGGFLNNYLTKNNLAALPNKVKEEGGEQFMKAVGNHTYGSNTELFKKINNFMSKRVKGGLGAPVIREDRMAMKLFKNVLKRKFLLPLAGAAAVPALNELYFGDKFFDKPVF
jgi:hypothetical protein